MQIVWTQFDRWKGVKNDFYSAKLIVDRPLNVISNHPRRRKSIQYNVNPFECDHRDQVAVFFLVFHFFRLIHWDSCWTTQISLSLYEESYWNDVKRCRIKNRVTFQYGNKKSCKSLNRTSDMFICIDYCAFEEQNFIRRRSRMSLQQIENFVQNHEKPVKR